jgi:hypothetical protein
MDTDKQVLAAGSSGRICREAAREALRSRPRRRPRPRIRPRGVMEYWSVGVLRQFGIAPRVRGVGSAFRAHLLSYPNPGLKPWAEFCCPFGAEGWLISISKHMDRRTEIGDQQNRSWHSRSRGSINAQSGSSS